MDWLFVIAAVVHLGLAGTWLGAMLYSQVIVQPRAVRFFGPADDDLEAFSTELGAGNRRPVMAIMAGLVVSGAVLTIAQAPTTSQVVLYVVEAILLVAAAAVFARVTWRLWPIRVFALPSERPRHREVFRKHAVAIVACVGAAFAVAVANIAWP